MSNTPEKPLIEEFREAIPDIAKAQIKMRAWAEAWRVLIDAADPYSADQRELVGAFYKAMRERGIVAPWPLRFGDRP